MLAYTGICRKGFNCSSIESIKDVNKQEKYGMIFSTWNINTLDSLRKAFGLKPNNKATMSKQEGKKIANILRSSGELLFGERNTDKRVLVRKLVELNEKYGGEHIYIFGRGYRKDNLIELLENAPLIDIGG